MFLLKGESFSRMASLYGTASRMSSLRRNGLQHGPRDCQGTSLSVIAAVYHPPDQPNGPLSKHMQSSLETILQKHPQTGIVIAADFNQLCMTHLSVGFGLKQIVSCATLGRKTLDKIFTNLYQYYQSPTSIGAIGTSGPVFINQS